tara:strand:- start:1851 stop:2219 length:369 start_codon:yes stop_codon:yes gene_type:complete
MKYLNGEEIVGLVAVDSGCIHIGDPCYTMTTDGTYCQDSKDKQLDWSGFCSLMFDEDGNTLNEVSKGVQECLGDSIGLVVSSGYGDGEYPVTVTRHGGRVASVTVHFIIDEEDDRFDWEDEE